MNPPCRAFAEAGTGAQGPKTTRGSQVASGW